MKQPHVEECERALRLWESRRSGDLAPFAVPDHNIWQELSRIHALMRCITYMERKLGADLARFKVLDVGCAQGNGLLHFLVAEFHSSQLYGVELFEERMMTGKANLPAVTFFHEDATSMHFADGEFDLLSEQFCFCHVPDDRTVEKIAREMLRVVKRKGYLIVFDWVVSSKKRQANGVPKHKIERLFRVGTETEIVKRFPGQLYPPLGRLLSRSLPFLYPVVQVLLPFAVGSKLTLLRRVR